MAFPGIGRVSKSGLVIGLHRLAHHHGRAAVEHALAARAMCALFAHGDGIAVHVDDRWFRVSAVCQLTLALDLDGVRARARAIS